ncbi:MAG: phenylalanine--tRNA ligase subunit beta, partial [Candidatus Aenigmatarchaeota archaeon]
VRVEYPDGARETPDMKPRTAVLDVSYAKAITGLSASGKELCGLLEKARYDARLNGKKIEVMYPAYRQDIMHQRDIIEDILISCGYNAVKPRVPKLPTMGSEEQIEHFCDDLAGVMAGMGFQEVLSYMLTSKENLFKKMNIGEANVVEIENFVSSNWCVFRNWLLPSNLEFLSCNLHREYPQAIFEIGDVVVPDAKAETRAREEKRLSASFCAVRAGYERMASVLDALLSTIGVKYELRAASYGAFIEGRTAEVVCGGQVVGMIGEIHPRVLNCWGMENPVASFELDAGKLKSLAGHRGLT